MHRNETRQRGDRGDVLARMSDEIVDRILRGEPRVDVEIAVERMRDRCEEWFPEHQALFDRIYRSRFRRIWLQFRPDDRDGSGNALPQ